MLRRSVQYLFSLIGFRLVSLKVLNKKTVFGVPDYYNYQKTREIRKPVGLNDEPIPWITYPALEYLAQFDFSSKRIFEFGSGHSSLWFASRAKEVVSVESNEQWSEYIKSFQLENLEVIYKDKENFLKGLTDQKELFDVILIDSHRREECCEISSNFLRPNGLIIFDNSDRFATGCTILRKQGFLQVDFKGFGAINRYTWCTSLFFKSCQNLPLNQEIPTLSLGSEKTYFKYQW